MRAYGYTPDNEGLVESEAEIVREAAARLVLGEPLMAIVRSLNSRGIPTAYKGKWDSSTLRNVLRNPRIAGNAPGRRNPVPAIVSQDAFDRMQEQFLRSAASSIRAQPAHREYLCAGGWLECGRCGKKMVPKGGVPAAYVCSSRAPAHGCGRMRITSTETDGQVAAKVLAHIGRRETRRAVVRAAAAFHGGPARIEMLAAQLREALEGDDPEKIDLLRKQLAVATAEWEPIQRWSKWFIDPQNLTATSLATWWSKADLQRRQELLSRTLDRIVVQPAGRVGRYAGDAILDRLKFYWLI